VKHKHPQHIGSGLEPTYALTARCHEIQVHTVDFTDTVLTHLGGEGRTVFFNTSPAAYMQGSSPLFPAIVSSKHLKLHIRQHSIGLGASELSFSNGYED